jgi:hypothetical protein
VSDKDKNLPAVSGQFSSVSPLRGNFSKDEILQLAKLIAKGINLEFESHFPKEPPCPPDDAVQGPKAFYRLVMQDPPQESDFLSAYEAGKHIDADPCLRCAVSVFENKHGAEALKKKVSFFKNHMFSWGTIPASAGRIKKTSSGRFADSHWSWWPVKNLTRSGFFQVVP